MERRNDIVRFDKLAIISNHIFEFFHVFAGKGAGQFWNSSATNLDTEIEKLNTDEAIRQEVINAVNSGKIVTIPAEDITMGDWHGTGYIVTNPETGAGAYMIFGGLNGGSTSVQINPLTVLA